MATMAGAQILEWAQMIADGKVLDLITNCEDLEIQGALSPEMRHALLGAYLIRGEKVKAKFLWQRTDEDFKTKHSDFNVLWTAGKAMWTDVNPIQKVIELPKSALTGFLIDFIVASLRQKALVLLSKGYSRVRLDYFASAIGATPEVVKTSAAGWGWNYDEDTSSLTRVNDALIESEKAQFGINLDQLTKVVTILEK